MKGFRPREALILREQRMKLKLTQQNVADEVEIYLHQYQRYEYGDRLVYKMPLALGLKLCYLLKLDPYELVFGTKDIGDPDIWYYK